MRLTRLHTAVAAALVALGCAPALAADYLDTFTLSTQGQSPWAAGGASGWSYNSGFLGGSWGSYAGAAPVGFGLNAMTGSANYHVPNTGGQLSGTNPLWTAWDTFGRLGPEPTKTILIDNPIPYTTIDTRTGVDLGAKSSGKLGITVNASAGAGSLNLDLPFEVKLNAPEQAAKGSVFSLWGSAKLLNTAAFDISAPYFAGAINAQIDTVSQIGATGCLAGVCTSIAAGPEVHANFEAASFDTRATQALKVVGQPINNIYLNQPGPIVTYKGDQIGDLTLFAPQNRAGGVVAGNEVKLLTAEPAIELNLDITAITLTMLPVAPPLSAQLALPGVGKIGAVALEETATVKATLDHAVSFAAGVTVTLEFDQIIEGYSLQSGRKIPGAPTNTVVFDLDDNFTQENTVYLFPFAEGHLVSRSYSVDDDSTLSNVVKMTLDRELSAKAGCFNFEAPGQSSIDYCAFDRTRTNPERLEFDVYDTQFALTGFNSVTYAVPEPSTYALLLAGLGAIGLRARRRNARG